MNAGRLSTHFMSSGATSGDSSVVMSTGLVIERSWVRVAAGVSEEFSSPGSAFCADSYFGIPSTPVLPQLHVKGTGHSAKSASGR